MSSHTALIADVKGSRQIENWPEVFDVLKKTLREANKRFADQILVKFAPTVGDEFQGALKSPDKAYEIYLFIKASLPVPIYCGLGLGEVEITSAGSAGLRGTAFYRARIALEACKKKNHHLQVKSADEAMPYPDGTINALLGLLSVLENSMTRRQRQIVSFYRLNSGLKLNEMADHFGIFQGTVSNILKAANFSAIQAGERTVKDLLKSVTATTRLFQKG